MATATTQIAAAEANGQAAINALEKSAQPNTPLATTITNRYLNDYMLRSAMATNARQCGEDRRWCYNGSYITSVDGWEFNKWSGTGYCIFNESTNHHGFGARDGAGHTAWMEGGHWAQVGPNIFITCGVSGSSGAATKRAAGNGYSDNSWT